mmetsp:Transcript_22835/g.90534  ORF Transcript_22835/g.90534 Transcript_22835/m.90534 type:complete len:229 (-) Transcript_22835:1088-1774(-)
MDDDSDAAFDAACAAARALPDGALSVEAKLALYALYKQATVGDCAEAKPAFWELERGAKWRAWRGRAGLAATEAREAYCSLVAELLPQGGASSVEDEKQRPPQAGIGGKAVSTLLVGASDEEDDDEDSAPALVAAARSGDVKAVEAALSQTQNARETTDAQGQRVCCGPVHKWSCGALTRRATHPPQGDRRCTGRPTAGTRRSCAGCSVRAPRSTRGMTVRAPSRHFR